MPTRYDNPVLTTVDYHKPRRRFRIANSVTLSLFAIVPICLPTGLEVFPMMRTYILMAAMTAFVGVIGLMLGGEAGLMIALLVAFGMNFYS